MLFLVLLLPIQVYAAGIKVTVTKEQDVVEPGGAAFFSIKITNKQIREDTFQLKANTFLIAPFSDDVESVFFLPKSTVTIPTNQEEIVTAKVVFADTVRTDRTYVIPIEVISLTNSKVRETLEPTIYVISPKEVVNIGIEDIGTVIPGRENLIKIVLRNNANVDLTNIDIFYTSSVFSLEEKVSLNAFEEKEVELNLQLDPLIEEGEYSLAVRLYEGDKMRGSDSFDFFVGENPDITEREKVDRGFLSYRVEVVRENEGNTEIERTVKYPIGSFQKLFTKTNPEGALVEDGKFYEWTFKIPPGDIVRIEIETDYKLPFFIVLAILILIGIILYVRKKDLKLVKEVFKIKADESGVGEVKVLLHLKNKSSREIYNIKILDFLPKYMHADVDYGTLKPSKIQEGTTGRRIVWEVSKLDPGEERIISYKVKSRLKLVGAHDLPSGTVQYFGKKKRVVNVESNKVKF